MSNIKTKSMSRAIKINDKVFHIQQQVAVGTQRATCPDGENCYINYSTRRKGEDYLISQTKGVILHRDIDGKTQSEPFNLEN